MKKILVLTMMVLLACSMSVMASDVTISGETLYEWYSDLDSEYGVNGDAEIVVTAVVDDYNTAKVNIEQSAGAIVLKEGYFTTALGKYMGLEEMGVSITVNWGYDEFDDPSYGEVTKYAVEDVWEAKFETWGVNIDVGIMDMVHLEFATAGDPNEGNMFIGAYGGMDPVWAQLYFEDDEGDIATGNIGFALAFGMDVMPGMFGFDIGANFVYDMDEGIEASDDVIGTKKYELGVAIATEIMEMAYFEAGFRGEDDAIFRDLFVAAGAGYMDMVGVDLSVGLVLNEDYKDESFDEFEASIWTKVGAAKFRFGYLLHADQTGVPGAPANAFAGHYAPASGAYDPTVAENGVVFLSGELDY